ncbi:hypothetical protein D1872_81130 [compost metagenome]
MPKPLKKPQTSKTAKTKSVSITNGKDTVREVDIPVSDNPEIRDGDMLNAAKAEMMRVPSNTGFATVGLGFGATINMGDYESARIDAFIIRNVPDNPTSIKKAMNEIQTLLAKEIERQHGLLDSE